MYKYDLCQLWWQLFAFQINITWPCTFPKRTIQVCVQMVQWLQIRIILKYFPICQNYVISVMAEKRQYNEHSRQVCFQMFQNPYIEEEQTTQCFVQYEIIGIHRSCRTTSTQWKNGRIDGRWPSIQKGVWWYESPTSVNLSTLGIPSTDTCSKKSTPANILELPSVKTYDGMITSTPSLPRPIEHWVS